MKLREKMKRFWTLDVHNHEGFTLVELIIVIAILAILSTGAIAGYSAYIESANRTVDESLAAEIENALILAYYNGILKPGATVVVHYGDSDDANLNVQFYVDDAGNDYGASAAMAAAFGENYSTLRLKWDGWKDNMSVATDSDMMEAVDNSNFSTKELDSLLSEVQEVVSLASNVLGGVDADSGLLKDAVDRAGVTLDGKKIPTGQSQAVANALVFSVAGDIANSGVSQEAFDEAWFNYLGGDDEFICGEMSDVSGAAVEYAAVLSMAKFLDKENNLTGDDSYVSKLNANVNRGDFRDEMMAAFTDEQLEAYQLACVNDSKAFLAYMNGVDASSESVIQNGDLNSDKFFENDGILNYVKDYVSLGEALAGIDGIDVSDGAFIFHLNAETGAIACLPLDY